MSTAVTVTGRVIPASSQSKSVRSAYTVSMAMLSVAVMLSAEDKSSVTLPEASRYSVVSGRKVA